MKFFTEESKNFLCDFSVPLLGVLNLIFAIDLAFFAKEYYSLIVEEHQWFSPKLFLTIILFAIIVLLHIFVYIRNKTINSCSMEIKALKEDNLKISQENENLTLDFFSTIEVLLQFIGLGPLEFGSHNDCNERISLYVHNKQSGFYIIGRYSHNPSLSEMDKTKQYSTKQGCLAKAWEKGNYFDNKFPDIKNFNHYYTYSENNYSIPKDRVKKIKMKSRLFYGLRIMDQNDKSKAVIMIESTTNNRYDETSLDDMFIRGKNKKGGQVKTVLGILQRMNFPNPDIGQEWEDKCLT
jgi:hypothetical protein